MNVLLGVTGGIAAYKAADLASKLVQKGHGVRVVMTRAAREFITPLTFESITGETVVHDLWQPPPDHRPIHITTAAWADILVVAPATANFIGKAANGIADDVLTSSYLAMAGPVIVAPAMNDRMWNHAAVRENVGRLESRGVRIVPPGEGWLADGYKGVGRLADIPDILAAIEAAPGTPGNAPGGGAPETGNDEPPSVGPELA